MSNNPIFFENMQKKAQFFRFHLLIKWEKGRNLTNNCIMSVYQNVSRKEIKNTSKLAEFEGLIDAMDTFSVVDPPLIISKDGTILILTVGTGQQNFA